MNIQTIFIKSSLFSSLTVASRENEQSTFIFRSSLYTLFTYSRN
nr:MAG TPA: hypothetical protein [Caudoviricetes sp.]